MTDSHPFFRFVWRANALLILGLVLVVCAFVASQFAREALRGRAVHRAQAGGLETPVAAPAGEPSRPQEVLHVGLFSRADHRTFRAPLVAGPPGERYAYKSIASAKGSERVRNILFFDAENGEVRRLFPDDSGRVIDEETIARRKKDWEQTRTLARIFVHVPADTNGDGRIDARDLQRIVATRPDGTGLVVLADGVDSFGTESAAEMEKTTLSYFVRRGGELDYAEFDLDAFRPVRSVAVKVPRT